MVITSVIAADSEKNNSEEWQLYENKKGSEIAHFLNLWELTVYYRKRLFVSRKIELKVSGFFISYFVASPSEDRSRHLLLPLYGFLLIR